MKKFKKLQTLMFANDITQKDLAKVLGKSNSTISARFAGRYEWELIDIYMTCDLLKVPYEEISIYFPKNGLADKEEK